MAASNVLAQRKTWAKWPYTISTDPSLIPVDILNSWFGREDVYWAKPMPADILRITLQSSLCFGMFREPRQDDAEDSEFIGIARCITDFTTFIYLTDVYILPSCQGIGLGTWLINCVQEYIEAMPYLRRSLLFTADWKRSVPFYERLMGMSVLKSSPPTADKEGEGFAVLMRSGKGNPAYKED